MTRYKIVLLFVLLFACRGYAANDRLFWHDVRLDSDGKLLSWSEANSPYHEVVTRAWGMFKENSCSA